MGLINITFPAMRSSMFISQNLNAEPGFEAPSITSETEICLEKALVFVQICWFYSVLLACMLDWPCYMDWTKCWFWSTRSSIVWLANEAYGGRASDHEFGCSPFHVCTSFCNTWCHRLPFIVDKAVTEVPNCNEFGFEACNWEEGQETNVADMQR